MRPAFRRKPLVARAAFPEYGVIDTLFRRTIMIFTPVILIHLATALASVVVGAAMFMLRKGTPLHRTTGRVWVLLMAITALVSFAIQSKGHLSPIHLLSLTTLCTLTLAVWAIRRRNIRRHTRFIVGTYAGLIIAGIFALAPARRLGSMVWHVAGLV